MADTGVMRELEMMLDQFFSGSSTNEQKLQISQVLEGFAQQKGVWRYCVHFIQHSKNEHMLMYSLNLLENLVTHMWDFLELSEKVELRAFLMHHLVSSPSPSHPASPQSPSLPLFVRNKLIKVVVLVGQADWPQQYPEFFSHILQLIHTSETTPLGLAFLLTASEELGCPRSDLITTSRKEELALLLQQQVPTILSVLIHILESVAEKQRHSVTPTPPPSPNVSPIKPPIASRGSPLSVASPALPHSSRSVFSTTHNLTPPPPIHTHPGPIVAGNAPYAPLDSRTEEVCILSLECLAHLFSWMALSSVITPSILDTIFHFASLGCDSAADVTENSGHLGSLAMDCINELLVKNCVPREFEAFLMKLFEKSFSLLQRLTGESERGISCNFSRLDDRFLAKCSDFFYWFVSSHLKRVEFNPHFPVLEFLELFFKYTFKQPEVDSFCVCLDTWGVFLDHLIMMSSDSYGRQSPPTNNHYERYKDILVSMMDSVLKKIQLHYNIDELREIDNDAIDDDNETEWQSFLRQSLEFVGKVAELFSLEAFQLLLPLLESYSQIYLSLRQIIVQQGTTPSLMISEGSECEKLHAVLKDLTSVLQALGRLSEHFTGDYFVPRLSEAQLLMKKFCLIAEYSTDTMLWSVSNHMPDILDHDFIEIHAQALGTLQAFIHWLSQLHLTSLRQQQQHHHSFTSLLSSIVGATIPLITRDIPEKIVLAACQLLLSLASTVRPQMLASLPAIQGLLSQASGSQLGKLPQRAYTMVHQALCHMLVLPWPELLDCDQQWDERSLQLSRIVMGATKIFQQLQQTPAWSQNTPLLEGAKAEVKLALFLLEDLATSIHNERSKSKSMLFKAISPATNFAISLFPTYLSHPDILNTLMGFFLALFNGLRAQIGPSLTEQTTQTFMTLLTREHLEETLLQEGSLGSRVVERFLCILQLLVQDGGDRSFLPSVISFVMNQIYPIVSKRPSPEIKAVLYELLFQLLLNNWRYFFPATILSHMGNGSNDPIENEVEFFNIMESFGHSFLQEDIAVFKQNLVALETLNTKHKLYSKIQFRSCMLYPFLQILLQALVQKSHDLLQEEICSSIYSMAAVDFAAYHQQFLPKFLASIQEELSGSQQAELVKNYKMVEDLPSFVQNIRQFMNDLRYFLILNKSVPAGSVKLS